MYNNTTPPIERQTAIVTLVKKKVQGCYKIKHTIKVVIMKYVLHGYNVVSPRLGSIGPLTCTFCEKIVREIVRDVIDLFNLMYCCLSCVR